MPDLVELQKRTDRFSQTALKVDISKLSPGDRRALALLIEASRRMDTLYMQQLWSGNLATWARVRQDVTPLGRARARYFWMNKGAFSALDGWTSFIPGTPERKPLGASFYPEDMTKPDLEAWLAALPPDGQEKAKGFFTVIRRGPDGKLRAVPYSQEYEAELTKTAALLRQAAKATDNPTLDHFLALRADALLSNDYIASDLAWMDLDAPIDVTFGPYETYTDELFGYKAAFEAYVSLRDDAETTKLAAFAKHLQEIENNLPIPPERRNPKIGGQAPIRVVQEIFAAGDAAHGVKSAAYNLPNDDRVVMQKGSKRVMLKNVQEAKLNTILVPISKKVLAPPEQGEVSFDAFFTHILAHELCHGLGPQQIELGGRKTTPRLELRDLYGATEEAKADVLGLFALKFLMDNAERLNIRGLVPVGPKAERQLYTTFLASAFRTLRFGIHEAHGRGMALQLNYLLDKKGIVVRSDGTFAVEPAAFRKGVDSLAHDLLMLEATGDRAGAEKMFQTFGVVRPEVQKALARLASIPTDIEPVFVTADAVAPAAP